MSVNLGTAVGYLDLDTSKFKAGFSGATKALKGFTSDAQNFSSRTKMIGNAMSSVGSMMTKTVTPAIVGAGAIITKTGATFESAMSQVAATMGKSKTEIKDLEKTAIEMGSKTSFSATQAAEGLNYLALAGYTSEQQIAALPKVLNLAAAGNMELAYASDMLTDAMSSLGLASSDSEELMNNMNVMVDQMAKTASKSNTSVAQLGEGILTVGGTAKQLAGGTTELNTVLGLLADNGIKASEGGTHLRNILLAMQPTTDAAANAFEKLGLKTYDAQGNLRPLEDIFYDLKTAMSSMTEEEKQAIEAAIFNKTDLSAVNALLSTSTDRWNELSGAIKDSSGAADKMSKTQLDNLKGDFTLLGSALEGLQIRFYNLANGSLRGIIQRITEVVDKLNGLSDAQLDMIAKIALVVAAIGPALVIGGKIVSLISTISSMISTISSIGTILVGASSGAAAFISAILPIAGILAGIVIGIIAFKSAWDENVGGIRESAKNIFENLKESFEDVKAIIMSIVVGIKDGTNGQFLEIKNNLENTISGVVNVVSNLTKLISVILSGIRSLWESNFGGIQDIVFNKISMITEYITGLLDLFSGVIKGITQLLSGDLTGALETFKTTFLNWFKVIFDLFKKNIEQYKNIFGRIISFLGNIFLNIIDNTKNFVNKFVDSAKEAGRKFIESIKTFVSKLPYELGVLFGYALAKALKFREEFSEKAKEAGKNFLKFIVDNLKDLGNKIKQKFDEGIKKAQEFVKNFPENAEKAGKQFANHLKDRISDVRNNVNKIKESAINAIHELPSKFVQLAKDTIEGFKKGFQEKAESVKKTVTVFANGIVDGFKSALDIHSPSKRMKKEVGEQIANGVIVGIDSKLAKGKLKAKEYADALVTAAEKRLETFKVYNNLSLKDETKYWDEIRKKLKKGTDERIEVDKKYFESKKKYTEQVKNLDEEYVKNQIAIYEELQSNIEELNKKYNDAVDSRTQSILSNFSIFERYGGELSESEKNLSGAYDKNAIAITKLIERQSKIIDLMQKMNWDEQEVMVDDYSDALNELGINAKNVEDIHLALNNSLISTKDELSIYLKNQESLEKESGNVLIKNLQSQVSALKDWDYALSELEGKDILPKSLVEEIQSLGTDATEQIKQLTRMSDEQLEEYASLYEEKNKIARERAIKELEPLKEETSEQIEMLKNESDVKLKELEKTYISDLDKLGVNAKTIAKKTGKNTTNALTSSIKAGTPSVVNAISNMRNNVESVMTDLLNKLRSQAEEVKSILESVDESVNGISNASTAASVSGSHKAGLDYVPYDGYIARLHKGEAVLTEEENKGRKSGLSVVNNFYGTPPLNERETARQQKLAAQQMATRLSLT